MLIQVLNVEIRTSPGLTEAEIGPPPGPTAESILTFPKFGMFGEGGPQQFRAAEGALAFPSLGISGHVTILSKVGLFLGVPSITVSFDTGAVTDHTSPAGVISVRNGVTFAPFGISGVQNLPSGLRAELGFPALDLSGEVNAPIGVVGQPSFVAFAIESGMVVPPLTFTSEWGFPAIGAVGEATVPQGFRAHLSFPALAVESEVTYRQKVNAVAAFAPFAMPSRMNLDIANEGAGLLSFPALAATGSMVVGRTASGVVGFPTFAIAGEAIAAKLVRATLGFPSMAFFGEGSIPVAADAVLSFGSFSVSGEVDARPPNDVAGDLVFPTFGIVGEVDVLSSIEGEVVLSFPAFQTLGTINVGSHDGETGVTGIYSHNQNVFSIGVRNGIHFRIYSDK